VSVTNADGDCWDYPLSYVDFGGFDQSSSATFGFHLDTAREITLSGLANSCWTLPQQTVAASTGCTTQSMSLSFTPGNCEPKKLVFTLSDELGQLAEAGHIVVPDYHSLGQEQIGHYANLLDFVRAYAPVLKFDALEEYLPVRPEVNLYEATLRTNGPGHPIDPPPFNRTGLTPGDLARYSWSFFTLDEPCSSEDHACAKAK